MDISTRSLGRFALAGLFAASLAACGGGTGNSSGGGNASGGNASGGTGGSSTGPTTCGGTPLTQWEQMMLNDLNEWRGEVSPPAAGMNRVHWDRKIAANTAKWISSCDPNWPDASDASLTNVGGYDVLGVNGTFCAGTGCAPHPEITDGSGMGDGDGWWVERSDYDWTTDTSAGDTSHYVQMVSSNTYAVGCATQMCGAPGPGGGNDPWWWTMCEYGPRGQGSSVGTKPYDAGSGGLVEPPASVFDQHPGLCHTP